MTRDRFWILLVLMVAAAVRLATWREVFTPDGVRFVGDSDTYYHVLRAHRRILPATLDLLHPGPGENSFQTECRQPRSSFTVTRNIESALGWK